MWKVPSQSSIVSLSYTASPCFKETRFGGMSIIELYMEAHTCNPSIWEGEAEESQVPGHPGLHSETLVSKQINK